MYKYTKRVVISKNGKEALTADFSDPKLEILPMFLEFEVSVSPGIVMQKLASVISGEEKEAAYDGHVCRMTVGEKETRIESLVDRPGKACEVNTGELYGTVLSWFWDITHFRDSLRSSVVGYTIKEENGALEAEIENPKYAVLGKFLSIDAKNHGAEIIRILDSALSKEKEEAEFTGDCCRMVIKGDDALIEGLFEDKDGKGSCKLSVIALRRTVMAWLNDVLSYIGKRI